MAFDRGNSARIANFPRDLALDPRAHLAAIIESSDDPIVSKDLSGTIVSWNPAATRVFGYTPEEILGRSILTLVPPELHEEEQEILRKLRAGERIEHFETVRLRKNGERFPISVTISPVRDETGRIIGASKIARDISERRRSDETRYRLAAIVDSADDAIISKDLGGIVRTWNDGARRMFGYTEEEIVGASILRLIPDDLQHEEQEIIAKLRRGERIDHYETLRRKKSGELLQVSVTISPIRNELGQIVGASKIARDISDKKRLERLLIQSEKLAATGRMAAAIAHEINNPLESLMNLVYLARQNSPASSPAHKFLTTAEDEIERVSHIARQTLGFYRDTGSPVRIHLHTLIDNVLTVYNSKLIATGIAVETEYTDVQSVLVSKGEIIQVLSNVIANAIDAMRRGGKLAIATRTVPGKSGEGIQITVRDTGTGIAPENLTRVFEPFFTTKGNLGTGVGLWVARQLIECRGGHISITSNTEPPSSGTMIEIFIPFSAPPIPSAKTEIA